MRLREKIPAWIAVIQMMAALLCACSPGGHEPEPGVLAHEEGAYTLYADSLLTPAGRTICRASSSMHVSVEPVAGIRHADWRINEFSTRFPRATVGLKLPDALYNIDVSVLASDTCALSPWSVFMSMAILDPAASKRSLRARVAGGRITSDPGAPWPLCSDRMVWILAAHQLYLATGDTEWAREAYEVGALSIHDDSHDLYRADVGLFCGLSGSLRHIHMHLAQWFTPEMAPTDFSLTSNLLYVGAFRALHSLEKILGEDDSHYEEIADQLAAAINLHFWQPQQQHYCSDLYGPYLTPSPVADNVGQGLAILLGVATPEMARRIMQHSPAGSFGWPALWPAPPGAMAVGASASTPLSRALYPMVSALTNDGSALARSLGAQIYAQVTRPDQPVSLSQLTGRPVDPSYSPPLSGADAAALRISSMLTTLYGIRLTDSGLELRPVVPRAFAQEKYISNLRYRQATLSIAIHGSGNKIASFSIDSRPSREQVIPSSLTGHHNVDIVLANNTLSNIAEETVSTIITLPPTPHVSIAEGSDEILIADYDAGMKYTLWCGALPELEFSGNTAAYPAMAVPGFAYLSVSADSASVRSFSSAPFMRFPQSAVITIPADSIIPPPPPPPAPLKHYRGRRLSPRRKARIPAAVPKPPDGPYHIALTDTTRTHLDFDVEVAADGEYFFSIFYSNPAISGIPYTATAIRSLLVNGNRAGTLILPQTMPGVPAAFQRSQLIRIRLHKGINNLAIDYLVPYNIVPGSKGSCVNLRSVRLIYLNP